MPALASGDRMGFELLMRRNLGWISSHDFRTMVTACATCTMAIRELWPAFGSHPLNQAPVSSLTERTMDICEFILTQTRISEILRSGVTRDPSKKRIPITYHVPCHLKKSNVPEQVVHTLKNLGEYRYVETADGDACCGMGGSFTITHYGLSASIGEKKARSIEESGASIVCTSCPACMIQLKDMLNRIGSSVEVKHVTEIFSLSLERNHLQGRTLCSPTVGK
jgi:glycolate oxidase iron-sulfur subunit